MYNLFVDGEQIEIEGFPWKIVERDRISMGDYLMLDLEVLGRCTHDFTLRVKYESMRARTDNSWILHAIRASLQNPPASGRVNLWL